ncbi:hypothetical protein DFJ74DRAFT_619181 [Hyaloraphidium curvatum]|nr:hypothetical protein DFJ74DRAFT_619181 [Hyaloraphidium curvatum]
MPPQPIDAAAAAGGPAAPAPLSPQPVSYSFEYTDGDRVNPHLVCGVCQAPFVDPVTVAPCGHTFCRECIEAAVDRLGFCPVDRRPAGRGDLAPANKIIVNMINELVVRCPNAAAGCTHTGQRQFLASHIRDDCQYATEPCPFRGCGEMLSKADLETHVDTCEYREYVCEKCQEAVAVKDAETHPAECPGEDTVCRWCGAEVVRGDLPAHLETCAEAVTECPMAPVGCTWTGERKRLQPEHLPECRYEAIRPFVELQQWRYEQLLNENRMLRGEVAQLRDMIGTVRADLVRDIATLAPPVDLLPHIDRLTADNERVTADVQSITADMASMDLRHNMAVMNESFRSREEMQSLRAQCQVMQQQILFLTERLKDGGGARGMPKPVPEPVDGFAGAAAQFSSAMTNLAAATPGERPMARRPSSARSSSADGSEHPRPMKL